MKIATTNVNIHYAKTHPSRLIDEVATTGKPIIIAKTGIPKVKIVPIDDKSIKRQMGTLKGKIPDNFDAAFADEIVDMFEGV